MFQSRQKTLVAWHWEYDACQSRDHDVSLKCSFARHSPLSHIAASEALQRDDSPKNIESSNVIIKLHIASLAPQPARYLYRPTADNAVHSDRLLWTTCSDTNFSVFAESHGEEDRLLKNVTLDSHHFLHCLIHERIRRNKHATHKTRAAFVPHSKKLLATPLFAMKSNATV